MLFLYVQNKNKKKKDIRNIKGYLESKGEGSEEEAKDVHSESGEESEKEVDEQD